jgi:hypothetical protein
LASTGRQIGKPGAEEHSKPVSQAVVAHEREQTLLVPFVTQ